MKVITELDLRSDLKKLGNVTTYRVPAGTILTPAARSFLAENKIDIVFTDEKGDLKEGSKDLGKTAASMDSSPRKSTYILLGTEIGSDTKPEAYTHLHGNYLVPKSHPRIKLRGKFDSLQAHILIAQVKAKQLRLEKLVNDLDEILNFVRKLLRAEVLSEPVEDITFFGLTHQEIREISHNPKKSLGVPHIMPSYEMGEMMAHLNLVRTQVRETELAAVEAFFDPTKGPEREDILTALNRLSSAVYVMMCRLKAGKYEG